MRTLIYVPIIHTNADLGSLSSEIAEHGIAALGREAWVRHQETVAGFWRAVREYCDGLQASGIKIYQDGMVADGPLGRRIAQDSAAAGSLNYQLVLDLLDRGACLVRTEKLSLVKREYDGLIVMTRAKTMASRLIAVGRYKLIKTILLRQRDTFIAGTINETLQPGETGILFIGALHKVAERLAPDIEIKEIKDRKRVRDYQRLLPLDSRHSQELAELAGYLIGRVTCQHPASENPLMNGEQQV
jgi:hypothetical protein